MAASWRTGSADGLPDSGQRLVRMGQLTATVVVPSNTGPAIRAVADALRTGMPVPEQILLPPLSLPEIHQLAQKAGQGSRGANPA